MLKYRLISSFILIPFVITGLLFLSPMRFIGVMLTISMLAVWEWGKLNGFTQRAQQVLLILFFGLLLITMLFFFPECYRSDIYQPLIIGFLFTSLSWWFIASFLVFFYPMSAIIWRNSKFLRVIFGLLIIGPFFLAMLVLRFWNYKDNHLSGAFLVLYVMLLVWANDSGSYVFGKLFGSHKLAPKVSPKKTWQGFIGGLLSAVIISLGYGFLVKEELQFMKLLISSLFTALASVVGDLTESMFKREAGVKNSGNLIPGHGGILDRIDSLMAAVPVFTCFLFLIFRVI